MLDTFGTKEEANFVSYLYKEFTCPQCGTGKPLPEFIKYYFFE